MYKRGIGKPASEANYVIVRWYSGYSSGVAGTARADEIAILSLNQYDPPTSTSPIPKPIGAPPNAPPTTTQRPPSKAKRIKVLKLLNIDSP